MLISSFVCSSQRNFYVFALSCAICEWQHQPELPFQSGLKVSGTMWKRFKSGVTQIGSHQSEITFLTRYTQAQCLTTERPLTKVAFGCKTEVATEGNLQRLPLCFSLVAKTYIQGL